MPLYEYKCEGCGERFEIIQKFSDVPVQVHEKCGAPVYRMISAPALHFKGSGWYITDYAKANGSKSKESSDGKDSTESAAKPAESKNGKSSETKSDTPSSSSSSSSTGSKKSE